MAGRVAAWRCASSAILPQTTNPDTGNTVDFPTMIHKIHAGSALPSVQAGHPYRIIGFGGSVLDWSSVVFPSNIQRCESCHEQNSGATQATAHLTRPTRSSCGSCHDNVNFATGENPAGGPQVSDNQCATCRIPQGELGIQSIPFVVRTLYPGLGFTQRTCAGVGPRGRCVSGKEADSDLYRQGQGRSGCHNHIGTTSLWSSPDLQTTTGYTSFGSDVTTPGYVSEDARQATCTPEGSCTYTFRHAIPDNARGSFSVGIEGKTD